MTPYATINMNRYEKWPWSSLRFSFYQFWICFILVPIGSWSLTVKALPQIRINSNNDKRIRNKAGGGTCSSLPSNLPSSTLFPESSRWHFYLSCFVNTQRKWLIGGTLRCPPPGENRGWQVSRQQSVSFSRRFKARFPLVYTRVILGTENLFADGERARVWLRSEPSGKKAAEFSLSRNALWISVFFQRVDVTATEVWGFSLYSGPEMLFGSSSKFFGSAFVYLCLIWKHFFDFFFYTDAV